MRHMSGSLSENCNNNHTINSSNGVTLMNINGQIGSDMFVATKSQPKVKSRSIQRQTKRPQSERRFKCDQCDRMFFTRKDVKRHMVVHTGIRNFACPFCTQRFGRKDHLVRHAKKSHNKDTRSSANIKPSSQSIKEAAHNTLILQRSPSQGITVPNKHSPVHCTNGQNGDHSTLTLLTNNNHHNETCSNANYMANHHPVTSASIGSITTVTGEAFYVSGIHNLDDIITSNQIKTEPPPVTGHHYLAFPVNSAASAYHHAAAAFIPHGCFVSNANGGVNSCGNTTVAAFGIPVPVCGEHHPSASNAIHALSVDVNINPSLPHFNQAFQ